MKACSVPALVVGVGLVGGLITGCGASASTSNSSNGDGKVVTLRMMASDGLFQKGQWGYNQVQDFMKAHPNIKVQLTYANGQDFTTALTTAASSNDLPDVIESTWAFSLPQYLATKWIQPVNSLVPQSWIDKWPKGTFVNGVNAYNGKIYSFPMNDPRTGPVLVYNKAVMKEAGLNPNKPPQTWAQLLQMSEQVTKAGNGQYYGFVLPMKDSEGPQYFSETLAETVDPTVVGGFNERTGKYAYDSPAMTQAVKFLLQMKKAGVIDPNSMSYKIVSAQGAFFNNKAAFMIDYNWIVSVAHQQAPNLDYGVAPLPAPKSGMTVHTPQTPAGRSFYISSSTKYPKQVAELFQWFSSDKVMQENLTQNYNLPGQVSLLNNATSFPSQNLAQLANVYKKEVVAAPVKATAGELDAKKIESTLPKPEPDWWQVIQGAYVGKVTDWQQQLTTVTQAYNARMVKAIQQAQAKGDKVTASDFATPGWDGTTDYSNKN